MTRMVLSDAQWALKEYKRIAMRACKTDSSFAAMIYASAAVIQSR